MVVVVVVVVIVRGGFVGFPGVLLLEVLLCWYRKGQIAAKSDAAGWLVWAQQRFGKLSPKKAVDA